MTSGAGPSVPTRVSALVAVIASLAVVALLGSGVALVFSVPGAVLVGIGAGLGFKRPVDYGVLCLFAGITTVGIVGGTPAQLLASTLLTIVAWDAGGYGVAVRRQLGRAAHTHRAEAVHALLTLGVGAAGVLVVYGTYRAVSGPQPTLSMVLLLSGVVLLVAALR